MREFDVVMAMVCFVLSVCFLFFLLFFLCRCFQVFSMELFDALEEESDLIYL